MAKAAGANRLIAEVALDTARIQRQQGSHTAAEQTLREGIAAARVMEERFLLPRLLAAMSELRSSQRRFGEAATLLDEAADMLSGLFTSASSPWVQSRLVSGMDEVFVARIRLEGARGSDPRRMYSAIEDARGLALLQLLVNRPLALQARSRELPQGERRISDLQRRLLQTSDRAARERLLAEIFAAEERLAPASTAFFNRATRAGTRAGTRAATQLSALQATLRPDEVFVEFALAELRSTSRPAPGRRALAVSASTPGVSAVVSSAKAVTRDVYDLDPRQLRALPSASDEARSVGDILGEGASTVLLDEAATEDAVKRQALADYQVLHFAVHGLPSAKFPARAALLLHPGPNDDGVLQAREILLLRLNAMLVTLSACDTGSGSGHGQDGPASLVRPFLASGARSVVANLWAADDTFSLTLMREFYRRLAASSDVAESLRDAKVQMVRSFGPQALPRLWSGVLVYGDGRGVISGAASPTASRVR